MRPVHPRSERFPTHRASAALALLVLLAGFLAGPRAAADPEPANPPRLPLWPDKAPDGAGGWGSPENSGLTIHVAPKPNGMAVIICPGGAYSGLVTGPEGHGIARWLNQHGILGAVLEYRLPAGRSKVPLLDAQQAIRAIRFNARALKIDPKRVGILGFSAGGHLAATASTQFDPGKVEAGDPLAGQSSRPDFTLLVYPVISMGDLTHVGVRDHLLGKKPTPEEIRRFSCDLQVTAQTPRPSWPMRWMTVGCSSTTAGFIIRPSGARESPAGSWSCPTAGMASTGIAAAPGTPGSVRRFCG